MPLITLDNISLRFSEKIILDGINATILKGDKIFINTKFNQPFSDKYFFKSAIFNLKDFSNKDALGAVEYCEKNKMDDVFIKDIISKIRKAM